MLKSKANRFFLSTPAMNMQFRHFEKTQQKIHLLQCSSQISYFFHIAMNEISAEMRIYSLFAKHDSFESLSKYTQLMSTADVLWKPSSTAIFHQQKIKSFLTANKRWKL